MTAPLPRTEPRPFAYRYHFTDFRLGRLLATLPMTGVGLGDVLSGASDASGTVPLASEAVRRRDPFTATVPRRSCLWAERVELDPSTGQVARSDVMWGGVVMSRVRSHAGRTLKLRAVSWESYFQRRLLYYDERFSQVDKFRIFRTILDRTVEQPDYEGPEGTVFPNPSPHHTPLLGFNYLGQYTGPLSGVLADRTYLASDLKPALELLRELSGSGAGFDWKLVPYMETPGDLNTFRVRCDLGYPRLGRVEPADLRWSTDRADARQRWGYVDDLSITEDGSAVHNRVTAMGAGSGPDQIRATVDSIQTSRNEQASGYPTYETSLQSSTQDLRTYDAVEGHAMGSLLAQLASETRVTGIKVRGDLNPVVTSYRVGDDVTLRIGETTTGRPATLVGQLVARTIQPPDQGSTETVTMDVQGTVV